MEGIQQLAENLPVLALVVLRSTGLFLTAPLFGQQRIPVLVRILLSTSLGALIFPFVEVSPGQVPTETLAWLIAGGLELLTGAIYGWSMGLIFEGVVLAGQFIGLQMGFAQANILNPESRSQRPLLSEIYFIVAVLVFFSINGHHLFVMVLQKSFSSIPLGQFVFNGQIMEQLLQLFGQIFVVALIIAAPINGILTLIDIILGLIARTAPQMNVLILGFSIKIYVGLISLLLSLSFTIQFLRDLLPQLMLQILNLF